MKRPAVFFDRDNTLVAADEYLGDPDAVVLIDGAADAVARLRHLGHAIVVVSNQSGVARGMYAEDDVRAVNARLDALLASENPDAIIDRHEYCPFHPDAAIAVYRQDSELRKPKPGMLLKAAERLGLDLSQSWMIGDAPRDIAAGHAAGCRTILFTPPGLPASPAAAASTTVAPDFSVTSLADAVAIIEPDATASTPAAPTNAADTSSIDNIDAVTPPTRSDPAVSTVSAAAKPREAAPPHAPTDTATSHDPVAPATSPPPATTANDARSPARLDQLAEEILRELRRRQHPGHTDFSVSKLFAGIAQVLVFAALFVAYLANRPESVTNGLLLALTLQTMAIALVIMGRQR